jgi:SAM-dependent methyltransferase
MGYNVVGVDLSPLMINEARRKSGGLGNVRFHEGTYHDLSVLKDDRFDVVLSNFGGLNCTSDITGAAAEVARFLKPAGYFVAVVMPPVSLWDVGAKVAKGRFATVARRAVLRETTADFEGGSIRVYYHSPAALSRGFKPFFRRGDLIGLNIFGPPPRNGRFATTFKWISQALDRVDDLTGHLPIVRSLGDHYVAVFQKAEKR